MDNIHDAFCPNKDCPDNGLRNHGNIAIRGKYGKDKTKDLLYCRTCHKRFAATRSTAFFGLHLSDEQIAQIIHHAAEGVGVDRQGQGDDPRSSQARQPFHSDHRRQGTPSTPTLST